MNKFFYLLVACMLVLSHSKANDVNSRFLEGNKSYQESDFSKATEIYQSIADEGYASYELYFNLGNAHYKSEHIPSAILYYEKALKLKPGDEDVLINLKLANLQTVDKIEPVGNLFLDTAWERTLNLSSADEWARNCIVLLFIGFILLITYLLAAQPLLKKIAFFSGLSILVLGCFFWFLAAAQNNRLTNESTAIIFTPNVTVKSAPAGEGTDLFVIHEGVKVALLQQVEDWYEISLLNGNSGWVKANDLEKI